MNKGFSVKINQSSVKTLLDAQIKAASLTAHKLMADKVRAQEIPFHEGTLQNVSTFVDEQAANNGSISIVHDSPYALRLYYHPEYNFDQTFNVNAKGEWWEDYISGAKKDEPAEIYKKFYNRITGGLVK